MLEFMFGFARLLSGGLRLDRFRISPKIGLLIMRTADTSQQKSYSKKPSPKYGPAHNGTVKEKESDMKEWKSKANWKDPKWKYTTAAATDISKTIARVRREMKEIEESRPKNLVQLKKTGTGK